MGCYVWGDKNGMGCYVRVTKTAWDVLSVVANLCGMFCPGCKKMAWDVLSRDVLSDSRAIRLYYPLWAICGCYEYLVL